MCMPFFYQIRKGNFKEGRINALKKPPKFKIFRNVDSKANIYVSCILIVKQNSLIQISSL